MLLLLSSCQGCCRVVKVVVELSRLSSCKAVQWIVFPRKPHTVFPSPKLHKYTVLKSRSKTHRITIWKPCFQVVKPRVSEAELKGFTAWNQGFLISGVSLLKSESKHCEILTNRNLFHKCFIKICKRASLHIYSISSWKWIIIQKRV